MWLFLCVSFFQIGIRKRSWISSSYGYSWSGFISERTVCWSCKILRAGCFKGVILMLFDLILTYILHENVLIWGNSVVLSLLMSVQQKLKKSIFWLLHHNGQVSPIYARYTSFTSRLLFIYRCIYTLMWRNSYNIHGFRGRHQRELHTLKE